MLFTIAQNDSEQKKKLICLALAGTPHQILIFLFTFLKHVCKLFIEFLDIKAADESVGSGDSQGPSLGTSPISASVIPPVNPEMERCCSRHAGGNLELIKTGLLVPCAVHVLN